MKKFLFLSLLGLPMLFLWGCSLVNNNYSWINTWDLEKISQLEQQLSWLLEQFSWLQAENEDLKETLSWSLVSIQTLQAENETLQADVDKYKKLIVKDKLISKNETTNTTIQNNTSINNNTAQCAVEWEIIWSNNNPLSCCNWLYALEYIWWSKICYNPIKWIPVCVQAWYWNYKFYVYPNSEPYTGEILNSINDKTDESYYECWE